MRVTATNRPDQSREHAVLRRYSDTRDPEVQEGWVWRFRPLARQVAVEGRQLRLSRDEIVQLVDEELKALGGKS